MSAKSLTRMSASEFQVGELVRYTPIIGGQHDGRVYEITALQDLHGHPVAWLKGKSGCVSTAALIREEAAA